MRKPLRFRHLLAVAAFPASMLAFGQAVGINATGAAPNARAILDLDVAGFPVNVKLGLMIPRMTEAQRLAIPVVADDNGLLVYQTDNIPANAQDHSRGLWYYSSQAPAGWYHLATAKTAWSTRGNTITNATTQYLGSTISSVNRNLLFRTAIPPANPAMQMGNDVMPYQSGFVGLGTAAPATERLEVEGAIHLAANAIPPAHVTTPNEGTIRYGTLNGAAPSANNPNWHWGTLDTLGIPYWARLENADSLITPPKPYPKDTLVCSGATGDAYRGNISAVPVTASTNTPCNVYSPFATNFSPTNAGGDFRVQYLYRNSELVKAGLCFPATINAFAFYVLDEEALSPLVTLDGEIRAGAATNVNLQGINAYFGPYPSAPYMDDGIRTIITPNRAFTGLTPSPGWINFNLTTPITLPVGANLIIDIVWTRNTAAGLGPKVELEDPGYLCTKWVLHPGITGNIGTRTPLDDNALTGGATIAPTSINPHSWRPVTRFTGKVATHAAVLRQANIIQYDGGLRIGSPAWVAGSTFRGPGTIQTEKGVYDAGLLLSDHVFDSYFDGAPRPEDAKAAEGYAYVGLGDLRERLERDRHLPNMPSRQQWEATGGASLGTITTGLWQSVEQQGLYISQLEKDLSALEEMAFGTNMPPQEARRIADEIKASRRLTAAQKLHLTDLLNEKARPAAAPKP